MRVPDSATQYRLGAECKVTSFVRLAAILNFKPGQEKVCFKNWAIFQLFMDIFVFFLVQMFKDSGKFNLIPSI